MKPNRSIKHPTIPRTIFYAILVVVLLILGNWSWLENVFQKLGLIKEVEEFTYEVVETANPLDMGPNQQVTAGWASLKPGIDGILGEGEWNEATLVKIDGTDRIRPGVATGRKNSRENRKNSGAIPYASNHAVFYLMNDEKYVYLAIDVTDNILDFDDGDIARRDSVELFVCQQLGDTLVPQNPARYFLLLLGNGKNQVGGLPGEHYAATVKPNQTGYVIELQWHIVASDRVFGFDLAVNDSDPVATVAVWNQYFWNGSRTDLLRADREYGKITLAPGK